MQVEIFQYRKETGWSITPFPMLDSKNTLILSFCAPEFINNSTPLEELKRGFPLSQIAGCSTAGEIFKNTVNDHSISVAVIKFDKTEIKVVTEKCMDSSKSYSVGENLAKKLLESDLHGVLLLSDGLNVNGSALVEGLKNTLPKDIIVTGGLAGDGKDFKNTWIINNTEKCPQCIVAIGLYGNNIQIGFGSKGGWDIFGPERIITRSKGNILYEIDGQPALELYKTYLGERANELPAAGLLFPLAICEKAIYKDYVVRTILSVNEIDNSITFAGDIPQGWHAQLMKANFDRLIEGASIAASLAKIMVPSSNSIGIAISCVGRRLILGERSEEEIEVTIDALGQDTPLIGFYSYGEISPSGLNSCDLHNQTMTVTTLSEK